MSRRPTTRNDLQVIGAGRDQLRTTARPRSARPLLAVIVALVGGFVLLSVVVDSTPAANGPLGEQEPAALEESSLLHPLGSPADVVEQFIVAFNYRDTSDVVEAIDPDGSLIEFPFLTLPPSPNRLEGAVDIYRNIGAKIDMYGCTESPSGFASSDVVCAITYDSDFVRYLGAANLPGTMAFVVQDGLISRVSVLELQSTLTSDKDLTALYEEWASEFFTAGP